LTRDELLKLLSEVASGSASPQDAAGRLTNFPFEELGFAKLDHQRTTRRGFPEVIFAEGKTTEQIIGLVRRMRATDMPVLVTRVDGEKSQAVLREFPEMEYNAMARTVSHGRLPGAGRGSVVILTAGTSDIPVAEEAAVTARVMGNEVETIYDVGVAGLHRLMAARESFGRASVVIVVAGMEGALASVVGGIVDVPVIGVPTSVGYGASFGGVAALLSMLNSCAGGVSVVNIDNGFGAAVVATLINRGPVNQKNTEDAP
jgi:pyridinium-3,5-biscarboxylic acid mononucleotide synthase